MLPKELLNPSSIAVVGASNDLQKPGGKVLFNLMTGGFRGPIHPVNPRESQVQGIASVHSVEELPEVDLAILAIPAAVTVEAVRTLAQNKGTRAFIVLSAGFSEVGDSGKAIEQDLVRLMKEHNGVIIGPNSIGILTPVYHGVFTSPVPALHPSGCDLISGSGATAVFILEAGIPKGLRFHSIFSVGNSAQVGVEEVLEHLDESYKPGQDAPIKLLYIENIRKPLKLLQHAASLRQKGCRLAAIKAGSSKAGSQAAAFHTGAVASPDAAVAALFQKAGIVRCRGREELVAAASVLACKSMSGKRLAIITHAGGPGVMLTDALEAGGFHLPVFEGPQSDALLKELFPGSSVHNPIDFLATGTADQLARIIDFAESSPQVDGMAVIFGTPGLRPVFDAYKILVEKTRQCKKPIFPILPSVIAAKAEIDELVTQGLAFFPDEVTFARALTQVYSTSFVPPRDAEITLPGQKMALPEGTILPHETVRILLDAAGILRPSEITCKRIEDLPPHFIFPAAVKIVGPVHKTEAGGVKLDLPDMRSVKAAASDILNIEGASGFVVQEMSRGLELYAGVKYEEGYGHLIFFGLGGTLVELFEKRSVALAPIGHKEALDMVSRLQIDKLLAGYRGRRNVDPHAIAGFLTKLSALIGVYPEIMEADFNPVIASGSDLRAVDVRIRT